VPGQKVGKGASLVVLSSVDVGRASADLAVAKSRLDQATAELEREQGLAAQHATSERAVLAAQTNKATAEAELHATQARLSTLGGGAAGGGLALTSPIAGTVLELKARVGQPVGPTDTLVVVGETDQVWLVVDVYERDLAKVHVGDETRVQSVAYPDRVFVGRVDQIGTQVDPERHVLEARIVLDNGDGALRPGMTASARIVGAVLAGDGGAARPRSSFRAERIQAIDGQPFVFVEKSTGKYELRAIERGSEVEGEVEIPRGPDGRRDDRHRRHLHPQERDPEGADGRQRTDDRSSDRALDPESRDRRRSLSRLRRPRIARGDEGPDRRRARRHERPGAGDHVGARARTGRRRDVRDRAGRARDGGAPRPRRSPQHLASRDLGRHARVRRSNRSLVRASDRERAARAGEGEHPAGVRRSPGRSAVERSRRGDPLRGEGRRVAHGSAHDSRVADRAASPARSPASST